MCGRHQRPNLVKDSCAAEHRRLMSKAGLMTRPTRRGLLAGAGVVLVGLGAWTSTPLRDIVQEAQGYCDWVPCVTRMTASSLHDCLRRACGWCFCHRPGCRHDASQSVDHFPRRNRSQLSRATSPVTTRVPMPQSLSNLPLLLQYLRELAAARSLLERPPAICKNVPGPGHPAAGSRRAPQSPHQAGSRTPVISSFTPIRPEGYR